jgi:transposase
MWPASSRRPCWSAISAGQACPALVFEKSREGFRLLIERIRTYSPLEHYLQELDIPLYVMQAQRRPAGLLKTEKRDAFALANQRYSQLELGVPPPNTVRLIRRLVPPPDAAVQLTGLIRQRYELIHATTRRKNKLTAICDELFPELTRILKDPTAPVALALRAQFPTPHALATASLSTLQQFRGGAHSLADAKRMTRQQLAADRIGAKDFARQRSLVLAQAQWIRERRLVREHIATQARERQSLLSFPRIGSVTAATISAAVGSILNFPSASALKSYFGWAPVVAQSGSALDHTRLTRGGTRTMKQVVFLAVWQAIREHDSEWAKLYDRLVKAKCRYDERTQSYVGKTRVIGRVAGQMTEAIYALLKRDAEVLSKVLPGQEPPAPLLYDPQAHRQHRQGQYRPLTSTPLPNPIPILRPRSPA